MPKIAYVDRNFSGAGLQVIGRANGIIAEYQAQGFSLTLRQLYYQFVARGLIANKDTEYKRLGSIINDARLAGRIDWDAIEDRTRWLRSTDTEHGNPDTWLSRVYRGFSKSRWADQEYAPEVWIEKDALTGIVQAACDPLFVPYFACRGYVSQSELWAAGQRHLNHWHNGKTPIVFHLGDHDPSGIDMTRDISDRLKMFCEEDGEEAPEVRRLALNMEQVREWNPPPNPAKLTDSRVASYLANYGDESWELDALDPATLRDLITDNITPLIDMALWRKAEDAEAQGQSRLRVVAENWQRVQDFLATSSK